MARFVIDTGDIEISREDHMQIQSELQQVTLKHVARLGFDKPFVVRFPIDWYGIILHPELGGLRELEKDIGARLVG